MANDLAGVNVPDPLPVRPHAPSVRRRKRIRVAQPIYLVCSASEYSWTGVHGANLAGNALTAVWSSASALAPLRHLYKTVRAMPVAESALRDEQARVTAIFSRSPAQTP
jgi:hypothetical protein